MTADRRTPGPDRPTDPRDELVQALLGLRWALPRTDADARVALDQLAAVAARVGQLAGDGSGEETPWDGQVQALLAQAGFALDWWRPVLDDVDLDWTLNHQAHLSADLARIASAGARILDQFAPAVPNPAAAPPSAVTEGPPQPAPRVAAAFGSVPASAVLDPLANSGRHRRPAYEFDAPLESAPLAPESEPAAPFGRPAELPPLPEEIEPELEQLFRPPPQQPQPGAQDGPRPARPAPRPSPIFGPPSLYAPSSPPDFEAPQVAEPDTAPPSVAPPLVAPPPVAPQSATTPPPAAFSRPVVLAGPGDNGSRGNGSGGEDEYDPIVRSGGRGPHAGMVLQAAGILGAVAALCWWAVSSLHLGSAPSSNAAAGQSTATATHAAHPAASAPAKAQPSASPTPQSTHSAVTPITTPPTSPPPPNAAAVKSIHVELLGGSSSVHQVAMILSVDTSGAGQVTVTVDYWGEKNGAKTAERTASWTLSGKTAYSIGASIPADAYCGETFTLKAVSGDTTATQNTSPGC